VFKASLGKGSGETLPQKQDKINKTKQNKINTWHVQGHEFNLQYHQNKIK
jgi:hypothetical protein